MSIMSLTHVVYPTVPGLLLSKQLFSKLREDSLQKTLLIAEHKRKHLICSSDAWS